ncbi:MAG: L,D-transpeptidase [Bacteroidales bacterium]|nr:L,D-transpeptidase [Bacteroidales bacterium]
MKNDNVINKGQQSDAVPGKTGDFPGETGGLNSFWDKLTANRKLVGTLRAILFIIATLVFIISSIIFVIYGVPVLTEMTSGHKTLVTNDKDFRQNPAYKKQTALITKDIQRLSRKYSAYTSGQSYIVINTTDNRFFLYQNKKLIREGFCSSGSYTMLQTSGNKKWVFKTPKGKYWIQGKTTNPVWKKPDWAFVEEGLPIPSSNDFSRYEYGVLGDYALSIGDGYMIHGTIYKRFLGMPVTHGCVRLNDEDLEVIYKTLNIGSKVYIF